MSRASDITLFLIIIQAAIGFVNATGLFTEQYAPTPQNQYSYVVQNLSDYQTVTESESWGTYLNVAVDFTISTFLIGLQVVFAVITIFPLLVWTFNVPVILSVFIQAGVYFVYAVWYSQYKSGRGWKLYE